jgi:hypothetical protein
MKVTDRPDGDPPRCQFCGDPLKPQFKHTHDHADPDWRNKPPIEAVFVGYGYLAMGRYCGPGCALRGEWGGKK